MTCHLTIHHRCPMCDRPSRSHVCPTCQHEAMQSGLPAVSPGFRGVRHGFWRALIHGCTCEVCWRAVRRRAEAGPHERRAAA